MSRAVIVAGVRTPFVKAGAAFRHVSPADLGRLAVRELLERLDLDAGQVDEVIAGNVASPIDSANVARVIALRAGVPKERIAHTVNRNCASGFECLTEAVTRVESGAAECVVAVGVDSMSGIPVFWKQDFAEKLFAFSTAKSAFAKIRALAKFRPRDLAPQIGLKLGLTDPVSGLVMGDTAEKLAREWGVSRAEQDAFALRSHERAVAAWKAGRFDDEVFTVYPGAETPFVTADVGPRDGQTTEALAKLKPYFDRKWGTVTVGNSCQVTDGAVALLVMNEDRARVLGYRPLGRVRAAAYAGCDPARMGLGPVYATAKALDAADLRLSEMERIELNEAFASQVLACVRAFEKPPTGCHPGSDRLGEVDMERLNVNGGAIALGHPVGATGARLVLTLLRELGRRGQRLGLATACVGGGQGAAVIVEAEPQ